MPDEGEFDYLRIFKVKRVQGFKVVKLLFYGKLPFMQKSFMSFLSNKSIRKIMVDYHLCKSRAWKFLWSYDCLFAPLEHQSLKYLFSKFNDLNARKVNNDIEKLCSFDIYWEKTKGRRLFLRHKILSLWLILCHKIKYSFWISSSFFCASISFPDCLKFAWTWKSWDWLYWIFFLKISLKFQHGNFSFQ